MKSQLERILKSDLSEYKIAVSEHANSLDHFEECLTERSNFMQNFNDLLKKQLERINQVPPNKFEESEQKYKYKRNEQDIFIQKYEYKEQKQQKRYEINEPIIKTYQQNSNKFQDIKLFLDNMRNNLQGQLKNLKKYIREDIQKFKMQSLSHLNQSLKNYIQNLNKKYQQEIQQLKFTIQQLKISNSKLQTFPIKQETNQTIERQFMKIHLNKDTQESNISKRCVMTENFDSPIENIKSYISRSMNKVEYDMTRSENILQEITVKSNEPNWKHFVCDLDETTIKQVKNVHREKQGKQNMFITVKSKELSLILDQKSKNHQEKQPILPVLLRKNYSNKTYDIPNIKSLIVSTPPIQQGFSSLKLGNETIYKGMWRYKRFHGKGKLTLQQYTYEGDFQHGLFHGRGNLKIGNLQYIGQFRQNQAQGQGILKFKGQQIMGRWKRNAFIEKY